MLDIFSYRVIGGTIIDNKVFVWLFSDIPQTHLCSCVTEHNKNVMLLPLWTINIALGQTIVVQGLVCLDIMTCTTSLQASIQE